MELHTGITTLTSLFLTPGELAKPLFAQGVQEWLTSQDDSTESIVNAVEFVATMTTEGKAIAHQTLLSELRGIYSEAVPEELLEWMVFRCDLSGADIRDYLVAMLERDHDNYLAYSTVFASLLSAGMPQDITHKTINTFTKGNKVLRKECLDSANAFYNFIAKYKTTSHLAKIAEECFGEYGAAAITEIVESDTYQTTYFDDINDLAKYLELNSLEFYTSDNPDMFYSEFNNEAEEGTFVDDMNSLLKTANTTAESFAKNLLARAVELYGESTVSQIIEDEALTFNDPKDQKILSNCYSILTNSDLFDAGFDVGNAQQDGNEAGAENEMMEALDDHEIFPFSATFSYTDKDQYCISFNMAEIIHHIFNECDAHEYLSFDNTCMHDIFLDAIFSGEYIKVNDLNVPHYGYSGYDSTLAQERLSELFKEKGIYF